MMKKKNKVALHKKSMAFLAAAALSAALVGGQVYPAFAQNESTSIEASSLMPENVTIDELMALSEISLPQSEYGTLSWADGSYVPSKRVESCEVVFQPSGSADLSHVSGWDSEAGVITGYVTVVVSSISEESGEDVSDEEQEETEAPSPTETPDISVTPEASPKPEDDKGTDNQTDKEQSPDGDTQAQPGDEETKKDKEEGDTTPPDQMGMEEPGEQPPSEENNTKEDDIFDHTEEEDGEDSRPESADQNLTEEEMAACAAENHSSNGISVSGVNLPWYVQFRVSSGNSYQFTNESDAAIFQSFEFELWDLQNDTEYQIPDGEYISVTVPVKEGYEYIIEHLLDNGATETIIPSVEGGTMVFSTHSFSPFGIAGSKPLVGSDIAEDGYTDSDSEGQLGNSDTTTGQQTAAVTATPSADGTGSNVKDAGAKSSGSNTGTENGDSDSNTDNNSSSKAVNTGDTTNIMPFVILVAAALIIIGAVIFVKKRK